MTSSNSYVNMPRLDFHFTRSKACTKRIRTRSAKEIQTTVSGHSPKRSIDRQEWRCKAICSLQKHGVPPPCGYVIRTNRAVFRVL